MKKKVLFISREFWPESNGTITCLNNFLPDLAEDYDITLYSNPINLKEYKGEYKGLTLKRPKSTLDNLYRIKFNLLNKLFNLNLDKNTSKVLGFIIKLLFLPFRELINRYGYINNEAWQRNLENYINDNELVENYDILIAVGNPFENVKSAYKLKIKNPHLKFIILEFDLYTDNPVSIINDNNRNERIEEEYKWFEAANFIFVTKEMESTILNSELKKWKNKIIPFNLPTLTNIEDYKPENIFDNNEINIVYSGMLYKDIRNPKFTLKLFEKVINKDPRIKLHIIGKGCEEILTEYQNVLKDNLKVYGHRSKKFTQNAQYSADILLNISNNTLSQAPSKILEYIGTTKPIINVYSIDNDICENYLKNYPLSTSIKEDNKKLDLLADKIYKFIIEYQGKRMNYTEVKVSYIEHLPETFSNKIKEAIEE